MKTIFENKTTQIMINDEFIRVNHKYEEDGVTKKVCLAVKISVLITSLSTLLPHPHPNPFPAEQNKLL